MESFDYRQSQHKPTNRWSKLKQIIIYLPGAAVILYGFWLSLSA